MVGGFQCWMDNITWNDSLGFSLSRWFSNFFFSWEIHQKWGISWIFLIDPAPWHTSGAGTRGEAFGGTDGEIRLQDRTYGTHVGKGGESGGIGYLASGKMLGQEIKHVQCIIQYGVSKAIVHHPKFTKNRRYKPAYNLHIIRIYQNHMRGLLLLYYHSSCSNEATPWKMAQNIWVHPLHPPWELKTFGGLLMWMKSKKKLNSKHGEAQRA